MNDFKLVEDALAVEDKRKQKMSSELMGIKSQLVKMDVD